MLTKGSYVQLNYSFVSNWFYKQEQEWCWNIKCWVTNSELSHVLCDWSCEHVVPYPLLHPWLILCEVLSLQQLPRTVFKTSAVLVIFGSKDKPWACVTIQTRFSVYRSVNFSASRKFIYDKTECVESLSSLSRSILTDK